MTPVVQMEQLRRSTGANGGNPPDAQQLYSFADLFNAIKVEDFSSYISKLTTPRELMLFMTGAPPCCADTAAHGCGQMADLQRQVPFPTAGSVTFCCVRGALCCARRAACAH
jgi:hypothetical protein